jgi:hypothetical protein
VEEFDGTFPPPGFAPACLVLFPPNIWRSVPEASEGLQPWRIWRRSLQFQKNGPICHSNS